jgi:hypothetical protein
MARVILENIRVDFPIYGVQQRSLRSTIMQRATDGLIYREGRNHERRPRQPAQTQQRRRSIH